MNKVVCAWKIILFIHTSREIKPASEEVDGKQDKPLQAEMNKMAIRYFTTRIVCLLRLTAYQPHHSFNAESS